MRNRGDAVGLYRQSNSPRRSGNAEIRPSPPNAKRRAPDTAGAPKMEPVNCADHASSPSSPTTRKNAVRAGDDKKFRIASDSGGDFAPHSRLRQNFAVVKAKANQRGRRRRRRTANSCECPALDKIFLRRFAPPTARRLPASAKNPPAAPAAVNRANSRSRKERVRRLPSIVFCFFCSRFFRFFCFFRFVRL